MLFHGFILRFRHDFHAISAIKRLLKQLRIVSAALVQNVRILIRYHCRLRMTGIPLHRLNIAAIQLEFVGDAEYHDYNLVIAGSRGQPVESNIIRKSMRQLIEANELPQVCFHSLRHSSITYKLKLNGGDIKAVQGDSGHAQATMVTDQYSHILDESRRNNAQLFEQAFYGGNGVQIVPEPQDKAVEEQVQQAGLNSEVLLKIFSNPDMVAMLKMLAKTLG